MKSIAYMSEKIYNKNGFIIKYNKFIIIFNKEMG